MYADVATKSIQACLDETKRRRIIQRKYNEENNITPESIKKSISNVLSSIYEADYMTVPIERKTGIAPGQKKICRR